MNDRIWIFLDSRGQGGIESHVAELATGLKDEGYDVGVVFLKDYGPHPLRDRLRGDRVRVMTAGSVAGLHQLLRTGRPRILHTHGYKAGILGRLAASACSIAVVSTFHAGEPGNFKMRLYQAMDRCTARISTNIAVSTEIAARLPRGTTVMDNFVRVPLCAPWSSANAHRIAFVGRLSEEKGADTFIEIACRNPSLVFDIYGDGPMRATLEADAPDNVTFHGMQPGMQDIWQDIGLLCMPSRFEGLPMATLEAMAHGIPVAAFGVGALPNVISAGVDGFIASPGDVDLLAHQVTQWSRFGNLRRTAMSANARQAVRNRYAVERLIPRVAEVYGGALGRHVAPMMPMNNLEFPDAA